MITKEQRKEYFTKARKLGLTKLDAALLYYKMESYVRFKSSRLYKGLFANDIKAETIFSLLETLKTNK